MKKENWKDALRMEYGIHFKDCPIELIFLEEFISDLLEIQLQEIIEEIEKNQSAFTGQGSEYNKGRADGYYERNKEVLDIIKKLKDKENYEKRNKAQKT